MCDFGGSKALQLLPCSFGLLALEASRCAVRIPKQPCGEAHVERNCGLSRQPAPIFQALEQATLEMDPPSRLITATPLNI